MKKVLIITADYNDADYVTQQTTVTDEQVERIKPILAEIKSQGRRFETGERADSAESAELRYGHLDYFEEFSQMMPYAEYGIHTIERVELIVVAEETRLL